MKKTTHRSPDRAASSLTSASGLTAGTTAGCGIHDFPRLLGQFRADVRAAEAVARRLPPDEGLAYVLSEVRLDLDHLERAVQVPEPAGLPDHWSASVRRNWWGTWTATGTYSGPELDQPIEVVSGWCWTRAQATKQVGYWIEDTELARAEWLTPTERQAGQQDIPGGPADGGPVPVVAPQTPAEPTGSHPGFIRALPELVVATRAMRRAHPDWDPQQWAQESIREAESLFEEPTLTPTEFRTQLMPSPEYQDYDAQASGQSRPYPRWGGEETPEEAAANETYAREWSITLGERVAAVAARQRKIIAARGSGGAVSAEVQVGVQPDRDGAAADLAWELEEAAAAEDTHENDVAQAETYFARQEEDHYRDLDWDQAIFEDTYRRAHGRPPVEYGTAQERGRR